MLTGSFAGRAVSLLLVAACTSNVPSTELRRAGDACDQTAEPTAWRSGRKSMKHCRFKFPLQLFPAATRSSLAAPASRPAF